MSAIPMVNYKLRDDIRSLTVCLYNPFERPEYQFTTDNLYNYISDCGWQLQQGEQVLRVAFYLTPSPADADRALNEMQYAIQRLRMESHTDGESAGGNNRIPWFMNATRR